jgi:queuine tRNA-ribosyltransferase subunit QTRTD1
VFLEPARTCIWGGDFRPKVYGVLDDAIQKYAEAQSEIATPDTGASGLEEHGFAVPT